MGRVHIFWIVLICLITRSGIFPSSHCSEEMISVYHPNLFRKHGSSDQLMVSPYNHLHLDSLKQQQNTSLFLYFLKETQFKNQACAILSHWFQGHFIKNMYEAPKPKFLIHMEPIFNENLSIARFWIPLRSTFKLEWRRLWPQQTFQSLSWCNSTLWQINLCKNGQHLLLYTLPAF